jgi:NAD-dependent oxidoreductase involved in siderophore biosynthesis
MTHHSDGQEKSTSTERISMPLPAVVGLIIALVTSVISIGAGITTAIWWASSISTKMDVIVAQGKDQAAATLVNANRISALELWQRGIDATGSPAMVKRIDGLELEVAKLHENFNLHEATTLKSGKP